MLDPPLADRITQLFHTAIRGIRCVVFVSPVNAVTRGTTMLSTTRAHRPSRHTRNNDSLAHLPQKPLALLISGICLQAVCLQAAAAPCPAASGGVISVTSAVDSTCSVGAGQTLNIGSTGSITVPNQSGNAVQVALGAAATAINNQGIIDSSYIGGNASGDAVAVQNGSVLANGITNSGSITGDGTAITLSTATVAGLVNSATGTIGDSGNYVGIQLSGQSTLTGGVDNAGHIGGNRGLFVDHSVLTGGIHNRSTGHIDDSNTGGYAIRVESGALLGDIANEGTIDGGEGAVAIQSSSTFGGNIVNSGLIHSFTNAIIVDGSTMTGNITNSGTIGGDSGSAILLYASTMTGSVTNSGTIETVFGGAIHLRSSSTLTGDIGNLATGVIDGGESAALNFEQTSTVSGSILNAGTITSTVGVGDAVVIIDNSTVGGAINNSGTITDTSNGEALLVRNGSRIGALINSGTIAGHNLNTNDNNNGVDIDGSTVALGITNSGSISGGQGIVLQNGAVIAAGGINNSGHIIGDGVGVTAYQATITGGITNAANASIVGDSIGVSVDTTTLTGNIDNSGLIDGHVGMWVQSSTIAGDIVNRSGASITDSISGYALLVSGNSIVNNIASAGTIRGTNGIGIQASTVSGAIANFAGGTITAEDGNGIEVRGFSSAPAVVGSIVNAGSISGKNGIFVSGATVTGAIAGDPNGAATGGITATETAILLTSGASAGSIASSGVVNAANGIQIKNSTVSGAVANNAASSINATATAILLSDGAKAGSITNNGALYGADGIVIDNSTVSGALTNTSGISSPGTIIALRNGATLSGGIVNSGLFFASNTGIGIDVSADSVLGGGITNSGTISSGGPAIRIQGSGFSGNIANSGKIFGTPNAIDLSSFTGAAKSIAIDNSGTLGGGVLLGAQTLNLNGNSSAVSGAVQGTGDVNVNGAFTQQNTFDVGTFTISSGGTLQAGTGVTASGGMRNLGTLSVKNGAPFAVTGDYSQSANATFLMQASTPTSYSKMTVSGRATLAPLTHIQVDVTQGATLISNGILPGVITAGSLDASTFTVTDNSALFDFVGIVNGNAVDLNTKSAITVYNTVIENGNFPGAGAARVLDSLIQGGAATGDMLNVISALGSLQTSKEISDAVQQTLPVMTGGTTTAVMGALDAVGKIVQARQETHLGLSSGDGFFTDRAVWLKPFGSWSKQGNRSGVSGYDSNGGGLAAGIDGGLTDTARLGFAIAYAHTAVDSDSRVAPQAADIDTYQVVMYGTQTLAERTDLNYQIDFGDNEYDAHRYINFGGLDRRATADWSGWSGHAGVGIGHLFAFGDTTTLTPSLRVDYAALKNRGYTEDGAGALNLHVDDQTTDQLLIGADAKLNQQIEKGLSVTANVGAAYDTLNRTNSITSTYAGGGAAFATRGLDPSPWILRGGIGLVSKEDSGFEVSARYDVESRPSNFLNQTVSVKFRMPF